MRTFYYLLCVAALFVSLTLSGCASKQLPVSYINRNIKIKIDIKQIPDKPSIWFGTSQPAKWMQTKHIEKMASTFNGMSGDEVKNLIMKRLSEKLGSFFIIDNENPDLQFDVYVFWWGWETAVYLNVRTKPYSTSLMTKLIVSENTEEKKPLLDSVIGLSSVGANKGSISLGDDPSKEQNKEAMEQTISMYADEVYSFVLKGKTDQ